MKKNYRYLEPILIEQGLTTKIFTTSSPQIYYSYHDKEENLPLTMMKAYEKSVIKNVFIHPHYVTADGYLPSFDLALLKIKEKNLCPLEVRKEITTQKEEVKIWQYPEGHPLQKMAKGQADFKNGEHWVVTRPGSSGSSLRDKDNIICRIHRSGINVDAKTGIGTVNGFIPLRKSMIDEIRLEIFNNDSQGD